VGGAVTGITVAVDVGQWIRCRVPTEVLARDLAAASKVDLKLVRIVPVQFPHRLVHAKAYAAISPGCAGSKGFVVVTSGNATHPGLGLASNSNLELAVLITQRSALLDFEKVMRELVKKSVSVSKAMQQDHFLRALALFSRGTFYHKWQGSLSSEIRFKLTLTDTGRKARSRGETAFRAYQPDADTVSRDPLSIESIFQNIPKPFPPRFWAIYSVETLLGYWLPNPVSEVVNRKLSEKVAPYIALPWIHRLFSNLKRWGLGVYHGLRKTNLQHYLDEFVFRFDTLLGIGARTTPAPYRVLIRKAA
jgi:hypothetical protein